jgi:hypothetical protein
VTPVPPEPQTPGDLVQSLQDLDAAADEARNPSQPRRLWSVLSTKLPPAANWTGCEVWVSDKLKVGVSNGTAWTQTDGGVL